MQKLLRIRNISENCILYHFISDHGFGANAETSMKSVLMKSFVKVLGLIFR